MLSWILLLLLLLRNVSVCAEVSTIDGGSSNNNGSIDLQHSDRNEENRKHRHHHHLRRSDKGRSLKNISSEDSLFHNFLELDNLFASNDTQIPTQDEESVEIVDVDTRLELSSATVQWDSFQAVIEFEGSGDDQNLDFKESVSSSWSEWSKCSSNCGQGSQTRTRNCGSNCEQIISQNCWDMTSCPTVKLNNYSNTTSPDDHCQKWIDCKNQHLLTFRSKLKELPECPCKYQNISIITLRIWSPKLRNFIKWIMDKSTLKKIKWYKPTAANCLRSSDSATGVSSQQCCYDKLGNLITRGPGSGTPMLINPEISETLHNQADLTPWLICKGDWTRYNQVRKPNNDLGCKENPKEEEFKMLQRRAKDY